MNLEPTIWGPYYWFFLHTISLNYPKHPNETIKKKYYDLIINFHLFIPEGQISSQFDLLLDKYPVSPFLDSRKSFVHWVHFIHNKINVYLKKPKITLAQFYSQYYELGKPRAQQETLYLKWKNKVIFLIFLLFLIGFALYLYKY